MEYLLAIIERTQESEVMWNHEPKNEERRVDEDGVRGESKALLRILADLS